MRPFIFFMSVALLTFSLTSTLTSCYSQIPDSPYFLEEDSPTSQNAAPSPAELKKIRKAEERKKEKAEAKAAMRLKENTVFDDRVYDDKIKSILIHKAGFQLNPPIINLGNEDKIVVRFDDHATYTRNYAYTVEHCTHDWKSSDLIESEYIEGFYNNYINNFTNSFNTFYPYTHHNFSFPNRDLRLTLSGNYLLKVFHEGYPDSLIFTRRFMVQESLVAIPGKVVAPRHVPLRSEGQEIQFSIQHGSFSINNPYQDLHVKLLQNSQWDNAITDLKPVFIKNNELVYDYDKPATFMAGNEYRFIDLKSFTYTMENILKTERTPHGYVVTMVPDEKRVFKRYLTLDDINGKFLIKNDDGFEDHTESDYAKVHFSLKMDQPLIGSDVYIYGGFNGFECNEHNLLQYDADLQSYRGTLLLKQGFYNYQYAVVEKHRGVPDITILEGSFVETENEYTILVYHRDISRNYDQLIGVSYVNVNER